MWPVWRCFAEHFLDLLSTRRCVGCDEASNPSLCSECRGQLVPTPTERFRGIPLVCASAYAPPLSLAVKRMKYHGRPDIAARLAAMLAEIDGLAGAVRGTCLVPVPMHASRLQERGFNQSALLARALSARMHAPVDHRLLRRIRAGAPQARCSGEARRLNILGAFSARRDRQTMQITLVDDVITTGSTIAECIGALEAVGHQVTTIVAVCCATMAD
jgi:ComF family protein